MTKPEPMSANTPPSQDDEPVSPLADTINLDNAPASDPTFEIEKLKAEVTDGKDRLLRAMAELENFRKRTEREREDTAKFAITKFAKDLLSVADNLRRALSTLPPDVPENLGPLISGVEATERELLGIFDRNQIKSVAAQGQRFDANLHEAVVEIEDKSVSPGTVIQVMAPGYTIAGRLLRAAMVAVAKGGPKDQTQHVDTQV